MIVRRRAALAGETFRGFDNTPFAPHR